MDVVVTGIGLASALGNLETTWNHLLAGQSGICLHQPFPELPPLPLGLMNSTPARLAPLTRSIVQEALADAGLTLPQATCGVSIGSSRGHQAEWEDLAWVRYDGSHGKSLGLSAPTVAPVLADWLTLLPHGAAVQTAQMLQTSAPVLSPMAACATGIWAIAQGTELIRQGHCQRVLAGAVEAPVTPLTLVGFRQMGALAVTGAYPFDCQRQGMVLGEGGAILVLESAELAQQRQARIYGRILGIGLSADGYHVSAPAVERQAAIAAINHCLRQSHLTPEAIHFIHTHGTATLRNDCNEAQLIQHLFPPEVSILSTKAATGHTIGASGALGVAFCLLALHHQRLPPCVGLQQPEFPLNFVQTAQAAAVHHALCLSFGFGGQNGAIALGQWPARTT